MGDRTSLGKMIVVDDEETNLRVFEAILHKGGFECAGTARPERAIELYSAQNEPVPLAIVDVKMPGLSGVELAQQFTGMDPSTRILFVSGTPFVRWSARDKEGVRDLESGSFCLLPKPFLAQSLLECVDCLLNGQGRLPGCRKHGLCAGTNPPA